MTSSTAPRAACGLPGNSGTALVLLAAAVMASAALRERQAEQLEPIAEEARA